jgi:hypothetical protein
MLGLKLTIPEQLSEGQPSFSELGESNFILINFFLNFDCKQKHLFIYDRYLYPQSPGWKPGWVHTQRQLSQVKRSSSLRMPRSYNF